ncbi:MAG: phytoene desaturase family protein [Streptosporangiaceae bacterium]
MNPSRYDAVVVGAGHNGLTAAAYLAQAGRSVLVLERQPQAGGATVSSAPFPGVDVRLSRYSYLVSLFPSSVIKELGLPLQLRTRRIASYTPEGDGGLLVDNTDPARTAASFAALTGGPADFEAWERLHEMTALLAARMAPTMTEPLLSEAGMREAVGDSGLWDMITKRPLGETLESEFASDTVRGVVLTDAVVGTFARAGASSLLQNRCYLYHVIGNGTGAWNVPVGGMGAVSSALAEAALRAGAELQTGAEVISIDPAGAVTFRAGDGEHEVGAGHVLANVAPATLERLLGESGTAVPEGSQLKVNMVLRRLPRLRDQAVPAADAFCGTFHVNEGYAALDAAYDQALRGEIPAAAPCESYCHSLTDDSILGPSLRASGAHTMTVFGLHMPASLFRADPALAKEEATAATLRSINAVLAEPIEDCLLADADGRPCIEVKTPADLEAEAYLPGGHIFHGDLSWPFAEDPGDAGRWGVETSHPRVVICGAGARRGGGVSGIGGQNAAMAVLRGSA